MLNTWVLSKVGTYFTKQISQVKPQTMWVYQYYITFFIIMIHNNLNCTYTKHNMHRLLTRSWWKTSPLTPATCNYRYINGCRTTVAENSRKQSANKARSSSIARLNKQNIIFISFVPESKAAPKTQRLPQPCNTKSIRLITETCRVIRRAGP